jgi:cytochrome b6-f complex iron-sulfur subunit
MTSIFRSLSGLGLNWLVARCLSLLARIHLVSAPAATKIARRGFIRNATLGAVAIVSTQAVVGLIRFWWPNKTGAFGSEIPVSAASIPAPNDTPFQYAPGKFYIIHNDDGIMALYWKCPHLGCTVPWNPGEGDFHCPCHGSIYDYNGAKIGGPAPRAMDFMGITVEPSGDISVDTGAIHTRGFNYDPSQATKYP